MSQHTATVEWRRDAAPFVDHRYSRAHRWSFDGGAEVPASSSPHVVPVPMSDPAAVDPEEAFVASLSSCHMLWFLAVAAKRGYVVDRYRDDASGEMRPDERRRLAMARVTLRPEVEFSGARRPGPAELDEMHHAAHESCFIARSVRTEIVCEPVHPTAGVEG